MADRLQLFAKAMLWIRKNTIGNGGIAVTSEQRVIYPEVTGYYIPTLLQWGEKDLAIAYTKHLCTMQKEDGAWYDSQGNDPYIFDTAQIMKGLVAIYPYLPEVKDAIIKGCDWLLSRMNEDGRLVPPNPHCFDGDETFYSELIHTYCLTPLRDAAAIFDKPEYEAAANKIKDYYIDNYRDKILHFSLLSHFYAYVMEGLLDMGERELISEAMYNIEKYQDSDGGIPGLNDVKWVCSTGMFQLAIVWYKLGEIEKGNRIFDYACTLQNASGGWFGSYPVSFVNRYFSRGRQKAYYFPDEEISWAVKYFLDALALKEKLEFERQAPFFLDMIDKNDGRYVLIRKLIKENNTRGGMQVCDIGCGKGRYLKNLVVDCPEHEYYAFDLSEQVMKDISCVKEKRVGSLTHISYEDNMFDFVYVCEAYEHAINLHGAFLELYRIVKPGGRFVIIDKPVEKLGKLEIDEWEQWISDNDMKKYTEECGGLLDIIESVPYEGKDDGLFRAWIVTKK